MNKTSGGPTLMKTERERRGSSAELGMHVG